MIGAGIATLVSRYILCRAVFARLYLLFLSLALSFFHLLPHPSQVPLKSLDEQETLSLGVGRGWHRSSRRCCHRSTNWGTYLCQQHVLRPSRNVFKGFTEPVLLEHIGVYVRKAILECTHKYFSGTGTYKDPEGIIVHVLGHRVEVLHSGDGEVFQVSRNVGEPELSVRLVHGLLHRALGGDLQLHEAGPK